MCGDEFAVVDYIASCPACGSSSVDIISGTEFQVLEMDIDDA